MVYRLRSERRRAKAYRFRGDYKNCINWDSPIQIECRCEFDRNESLLRPDNLGELCLRQRVP